MPLQVRVEFRGGLRDIIVRARNKAGDRAKECRKGVKQEDVPQVVTELIVLLEEKLGGL